MNVMDVENEYKKRLEDMAINECCCLVYTVCVIDFQAKLKFTETFLYCQ